MKPLTIGQVAKRTGIDVLGFAWASVEPYMNIAEIAA